LFVWNNRLVAGVKFLANCLGLSSEFVMQDQDLAQKQLDNEFDSNQKFDFLMNRLSNVKLIWNDLNLGDYKYFGGKLDMILQDQEELSPICKKVCDQNLFFVLCGHHTDIKIILKKWPNARVICFANDENFIKKYRKSYLNDRAIYWETIRGENWPKDPPKTLEEIRALPTHIQHDLENIFENQIYGLVNCKVDDVTFVLEQFVQDCQPFFIWDCDWYFDTDATTNAVKQLYDLLGLTDFDPNKIKTYHSEWIKKLHSI